MIYNSTHSDDYLSYMKKKQNQTHPNTKFLCNFQMVGTINQTIIIIFFSIHLIDLLLRDKSASTFQSFQSFSINLCQAQCYIRASKLYLFEVLSTCTTFPTLANLGSGLQHSTLLFPYLAKFRANRFNPSSSL